MPHYSFYEDRDYLLEYNQVALDNITPVDILGVKITNLSRTQATVVIMDMIEKGGTYHVLPLNPWKLEKTKSGQKNKTVFSTVDLMIAEGAGLQWAAKKLKTPLKERIPLLSLMMDLVRISELKEYTIFLIGGKPETTELAYKNIKRSFPNIRIVGRHGGFFDSEREKDVIEAIRKSEANIVFVGMGFPIEDRWIHKIRKEFRHTVFISVGGTLDVIAGKRKSSTFMIERGLDWFYRIITRPWRFGRFLRTLKFFIHARLRGFRVKKKSKKLL